MRSPCHSGVPDNSAARERRGALLFVFGNVSACIPFSKYTL